MQAPQRDGISNLFNRILRGAPTAPSAPKLHVTSHVARDLLQNAAYFNSVPKAVAEYVSNAIDNAPARQVVHCTVKIGRDEIRISDDAAGMSYTELSNFFQMHAVNFQRARGRAVRGKFGTGKSAVFADRFLAEQSARHAETRQVEDDEDERFNRRKACKDA